MFNTCTRLPSLTDFGKVHVPHGYSKYAIQEDIPLNPVNTLFRIYSPPHIYAPNLLPTISPEYTPHPCGYCTEECDGNDIRCDFCKITTFLAKIIL